MQSLLPEGWPRPKGYANGIATSGTQVFVAGQVGWHPTAGWQTDDFTAQVRQALENTMAVLAEAGARGEHIARMTWYVTDKQAYLSNLREIGAVYGEIVGRNYPAMTLVEVTALVEDRALVEIETTAVVPD